MANHEGAYDRENREHRHYNDVRPSRKRTCRAEKKAQRKRDTACKRTSRGAKRPHPNCPNACEPNKNQCIKNDVYQRQHYSDNACGYHIELNEFASELHEGNTGDDPACSAALYAMTHPRRCGQDDQPKTNHASKEQRIPTTRHGRRKIMTGKHIERRRPPEERPP